MAIKNGENLKNHSGQGSLSCGSSISTQESLNPPRLEGFCSEETIKSGEKTQKTLGTGIIQDSSQHRGVTEPSRLERLEGFCSLCSEGNIKYGENPINYLE